MADQDSSRRNAFPIIVWVVILGSVIVGLYIGLKPVLEWLGISQTESRSDFRLFAALMLGIGFGILRALMNIDEKLRRINGQLAVLLDPDAGRLARMIEPLSAINAHARAIREWTDTR
ncbi:MAG TPA: DUF4345 family protein [Bryobacteraceae bacterium]|nr:DUF4345 family protein [Bryobacteraceae bacterium]